MATYSQKIVNKAEHWHRHGKVSGLIRIGLMIEVNKRLAKKRERTPMFDSVEECFRYYARR